MTAWGTLTQRLSLAAHLSLSDIRVRYVRAVLGPWWITLNTAVTVVGVGFVYSKVFGVDISKYLPFFAISIVMWNFFANTTVEATSSIVGGGGYIKDRGVPAEVFVWQTVLRNLIILAHTLPVGIVALVMFRATTPIHVVMALPGLLLMLLIAAFTAALIAPAAARFRDVARIVESGVFLLFIISPVLWDPASIKTLGASPLAWNPIYSMLESWRRPLIHGEFNITALLISTLFAIILGLLAVASRRFLRKAAFWI